ncbi:MAG: NAD(P)/FAD-dependent oxidoreductase, partial [Endomicrobiia bacterium]
AAEVIRKLDNSAKIIMVSDENYPIYSRCLLSYYLAGDINEEKLKYRQEDFFEQNFIEPILGKKVLRVEPHKKFVVLEDGSTVEYDKLLIATGSRSKMENIPGKEKYGVFGLRNISDAKQIDTRLGKTKTAVMLGGGLIGLKTAYAVHKRGVKVIVVVKSPHILSQIMDKEAAEIVQKHISQQGIEIQTNLAAKEILGSHQEVEGVKLENDTVIECELIIVGKGVQPNIELAKDTEIKTNYGIVVNEYLQTSIDDIYAAGDVAECKDLISGNYTINALWPNAVLQGKIAGYNMVLGNTKKYDGSLAMNSVDFFNLPVITCGVTKRNENIEVLVTKNERKCIYKKFLIKNGCLIGFVLIGDIQQAGVYNSLVRKKVDITKIKEYLTSPKFDFAKILPLVKDNKDKFFEHEYSEIR